ncbi:hypothetical protein NYE69_33225 [Paenibacillus sp. FSL R5-0527]|uniref:hypothetical protein n=1 Tax=Paenibacillus sp. FSL R5-0527 TaxID=2975321 RepID=UPI00097AE0DD|nr:hypothetical protein BK140_32450 [Paenibacillus macerans]
MKELALTKDQYDRIMSAVWVMHRFGGLSDEVWNNPELVDKCKNIKYVRPNWDMRDGMCFSIRFDGLFGKDGTITFNSGYGETVPMYDRIMEWLNSTNGKEAEA